MIKISQLFLMMLVFLFLVAFFMSPHMINHAFSLVGNNEILSAVILLALMALLLFANTNCWTAAFFIRCLCIFLIFKDDLYALPYKGIMHLVWALCNRGG